LEYLEPWSWTMPLTATPLSNGMADYVKQYEDIRSSAHDLADDLNAEQFNWRMAPNRWSIGECLAHLNLTAEASLGTIDQLVAECQLNDRRASGPFRYRIRPRLFLWILEPPYRMKVKTFPDLTPASALDRDPILGDFLRLQNAMLHRIRTVDGYDLGSVQARNRAGFQMHLGEWFAFVAAHERRHLWQAGRNRAHPSFPKATAQ
jgi:hypothetical protein